MELYLLLALFGTVLGLAAFFLRKSSLGQVKVSRRVTLGSVGIFLGLGLVYCLVEGFGWLRPVTYGPGGPSLPGENVYLPPGEYPSGPLAVGIMAPALQAHGWINGPPPAGPPAPRLTVVDIWALW